MYTFQIKYPNGNIYKGSVKIRVVLEKIEKIREGYGIMYYKNGTKFEGEYVNDKINGFGIYTNKEGRVVYEGYWKNGKREGYGIYYCDDGAVYKGEWNNNLKEGIGIYSFSDGSKYMGDFKNDIRDGYGIIYGNNSDKYEGQWFNDQGNGIGTYYYNKGDVYIGFWKNGLRDGYGVLTTQEGVDKKGNPYEDGKINSVTILSDPNNKLNKDSQVKQVFRKVEEANEKKDNDAYYYTKAIGDKIKRGLEPIKTTRETDIKDIYNKVKGDMSNKSEDDEYIFIIKVKGDKSINDALNKIKASGAMISKADKEEEIDYNLNKIKGNTKMKEIYNNVKRPNGAVLIKAAEGTDYDDVLNQVKSSQLLESKPDDEEKEKEEDLLHQKIQDDSSTKKSTLKGAQKLEKFEGDKPIQYMLVTNDILSKYDKTNKIADLFKNEKKKIEPKGKPLYLYRKISRPPAEGDSQLNNIKENENLDDLYQKLKNSKIITDKPGEGIQIFKVIGPADSNDYMKHINESEALYKKPGDDDGQIRIQSVKLYPHGKDSDENNAIVYIKVMGGFKPDIFYKSQG
jgi:hypothetical protein